jgi:predicted transcriptional regulator
MRTLVDLSETQIEALAALCDQVGRPRETVIREAVAEYLERRAVKRIPTAYGLWGAEATDGLIYQEKARAAW